MIDGLRTVVYFDSPQCNAKDTLSVIISTPIIREILWVQSINITIYLNSRQTIFVLYRRISAMLRPGAKLHLISFNVTLNALFWDCLDQCCQMSRHYDLQFWRFWLYLENTVLRWTTIKLLSDFEIRLLDIMIFNLGHFVRKLWLYLENTALVVSVDSSSNFNLTSFFTRFFHCCLDQ